MAKQRSHSSFRTIEDVLSKEKEFLKFRESIKNYNIVDEFPKIFPELSEIAKAVKVDKKVLFLSVENSVWKSELNFRKNLVAEKINIYFGEEIIKSVKFL